jgi:hypothetical protein
LLILRQTKNTSVAVSGQFTIETCFFCLLPNQTLAFAACGFGREILFKFMQRNCNEETSLSFHRDKKMSCENLLFNIICLDLEIIIGKKFNDLLLMIGFIFYLNGFFDFFFISQSTKNLSY